MKKITEEDLNRLPHKSQVRIALFAAETVFYLVPKEHQKACKDCIDVVYLWVDGKATKEEVEKAEYATWSATRSAARYAVGSAIWSAIWSRAESTTSTAWSISYAFNALPTEKHEAFNNELWAFYNDLLTFETIVEDVLLA